MGIVDKQRKEIERLNSQIKMLKRMCKYRDQDMKRMEAAMVGAEAIVKVLIARNGGRIEIRDDEIKNHANDAIICKMDLETASRTYEKC